MRPFALMFLLLSFLMFYVSAHAEGSCPPGMIPYSGTDVSSCGPIPPGYYQQPSQLPVAPPPRWKSRWGAIAISIDGNASAIGMVTDKSSRQEAEQSALTECRSKGGRTCKLETTYANGCAVVVAGDKGHNSSNGATLDEAIQIGMKTCSAEDAHCHVYFTSCSQPERVQ